MDLNAMLDRVSERRRALNLSKRALGLKAGRSGDLIRNWERRAESGKPVERGADNDAIEAVAKVLGVTGDWLREGGEGALTQNNAHSEMLRYVPVMELDTIECEESGLKVQKTSELGFPAELLQRATTAPLAMLRVVTMRGESMAPMLMDGDMALVDLTRRSTYRDGMFALRYGDVVRIRQLDRSPDSDRLIVEAKNPAFRSFEVDPESVDVIGQVVWVGRRT